jgi:hypothetical protein
MFGGVRENRRALPPEPATEPPPLDISSPQQGTPTRNLLRAPGHFRSTRSSQRTAMARERVGDSEQEKGAGVAFAKPALGTFSANRSRRRAPETDMAEQPAGSRSPSGLPFCCCHSSVQGYRTGPFQFQQPIPTGTPSRANDQCLDPFLPRMPHDVVPQATRLLQGLSSPSGRPFLVGKKIRLSRGSCASSATDTDPAYHWLNGSICWDLLRIGLEERT